MEDKEVCNEETDNSIPIDRGYAWVIVISAFGLFAVSAGGFKCQGVLFVEVVDRFEGVYEPSTLLAVFTVAYMLGKLSGLAASILILKIGHRAIAMMAITSLALSFVGLAYAPNLPALFIMYSLPGGIGGETLVITCLLVSVPYFKQRRALAIGLAAGGSGFGAILLPYIIRFLFDQMDFSGALVLYAGFHLQFLCLASLLRPISYYKRQKRNRARFKNLGITNIVMVEEMTSTTDADDETEDNSTPSSKEQADSQPTTEIVLDVTNLSPAHADIEFSDEPEEEVKNVTSSVKEKFNWRILLFPKFVMLLLSIVIYTLGNSVIYTCVPALGEEIGIPRELTALALVVAGGLEIPCRTANGYFADRKIISATSQYTICIFMAGSLSLLCTVIPGLAGVVLALVGMSTMGMAVFNLLPLVVKDLIGEQNVTSGMGLQTASQAIGFLASTYITAEIYDATGTWRTVFFYISGAMMLGSVVMWPYLIHRRVVRH